MMLNVEYKGYCAKSNNYGVDEDRSKVEFEFVFQGGIGFESVELVNAVSRYRSSGSGMSPRTIARANDIRFFKVESAHLALMDRSAVVPTWGRSGKGLDLSLLTLPVMSDDAHRVSRLDLLDILPTDLVTGEWIDDHKPLVVEDDCRMKEDLISESAGKERPRTGNHPAGESVVKEIHVSERAKEEETQEGEDVRARRAEELAICHEEIFSCVREMRAA